MILETGSPMAVQRFMKKETIMSGYTTYQAAYEQSLIDPEGFWKEAAEAVSWVKKWDRVLDDTRKPFYRWFTGGQMNTCYNTVDLHVETGRGDQVAVIYDSPATRSLQKITYRNCRIRYRDLPVP